MTKGEPQDPRDILIAWMEDRGCTQTWLADKIGYTRAMVNWILKKRKPMSKRMVRDLREKLDVPVEWSPNQPIVELGGERETTPQA